jgi:hypothetical protein
VVERGGLENRYTFTGIEGSNPSLSAIRSLRVEWRIENEELRIRNDILVSVFCSQFSILNSQFGAAGEMAEWLKAHAWKACVR